MRTLGRALVLVALISATPWTHAQSPPAPGAVSLRGLDGVSLYVADTDPDLHDRGVTAKSIEAAATLVLREAGIPLLNQGDEGRSEGNPILVVDVMGILGPSEDQCTYSVQVELTQDVELVRDEEVRLGMVPTWRMGGIAHVGREWRELILSDVEFYTAEFAAAYHAAVGR